jgi:uncharacterized RDD family membrane protein YckC
MTNPKDSKTTKVSEEKTENQEWEFDTILPKVKYEEDHKKTESQVNNTHMVTRKTKRLALDESAVPRTKTRSAMALEVQGAEDHLLKDEYNFAPLPKRAVAFVLDTVWLAGILFVVKFSSPILGKIVQYFMDNYKLKFMFPESIVRNGIMGITGFLALFFLIVLPVAFFYYIFWCILFCFRFRGDEKYTISISQAFKRELIMKPLSIAIVAGFITPFISKKRSSIHDMLAGTIVIED